MKGIQAMKNALKTLEDLNCYQIYRCVYSDLPDDVCDTLAEYESCQMMEAMAILRRAIKYHEKKEEK